MGTQWGQNLKCEQGPPNPHRVADPVKGRAALGGEGGGEGGGCAFRRRRTELATQARAALQTSLPQTLQLPALSPGTPAAENKHPNPITIHTQACRQFFQKAFVIIGSPLAVDGSRLRS